MKVLNLIMMSEYEPISNDNVDILHLTYGFLTGVDLRNVTCEIHYQGYDSDDNRAVAMWTSDTPENMMKIPFNAAFEHISDENNLLTGFNLLSEDELGKLGDLESTIYWKKEWFFTDGDQFQVVQNDPDKCVLGILDKNAIADLLNSGEIK